MTEDSRFRRHGGRGWSQEIETTVSALRMRIGMIRGRPVLPVPEDARLAWAQGTITAEEEVAPRSA